MRRRWLGQDVPGLAGPPPGGFWLGGGSVGGGVVGGGAGDVVVGCGAGLVVVGRGLGVADFEGFGLADADFDGVLVKVITTLGDGEVLWWCVRL